MELHLLPEQKMTKLSLYGSLSVGVALIAFTVTVRGCSLAKSVPTSPLDSRRPVEPRFPLEASPDPVSLGSLAPGEGAEAQIGLRNRHPSPIVVQTIDSSCPCIEIQPSQVSIDPGKSATLRAKFKPQVEPDFRGRLGVDVTGSDGSGAIVFRTKIKVEILSYADH